MRTLIVLAIVAAAVPGLASAQGQAQGQGQGHELVFVVDQSGSMGRYHNANWAPNDPDEHRVGAVIQAFETVQRHLDDHRQPGVSHRIHILEFGDTVQHRADLTTSATHDPRALGAAKQKLDRLVQGLRARDLGNTDTAGALSQALSLLNTFGGTAPDRVHVILVTDGRPTRPGTPTHRGTPYYIALNATARQIAAKATFDVIGLIGPEDREAYWGDWGPFWTAVSNNNATAVRNGVDLSQVVDGLIRNRIGLPALATVPNPFFCPPYLRAITFVIFKSARGGHARIKDALGRELSQNLAGVTMVSQRTYSHVTVADPPPGLWEFDQVAARTLIDPLYEQIVRDAPKMAVNARVPVTFRYQVLSRQGREFTPLPQYPVQAVLTITEADGKQRQVPMQHESKGAFQAAAPYEFGVPGGARLRFEGSTSLASGARHTVFSTDEVLQITNKSLLQLAAGASLPVTVSTIAGRAELHPSMALVQDSNRSTLDVSTVSSAPARLVQFRLVMPDGSPASDWINAAVGAAGRLDVTHGIRGSIASLDWLFRRPAPLFAEVRVDDSVLRSDYAVRGLTRDGGEPVYDKSLVAPPLLRSPFTAVLIVRESLASYVAILGAMLLAAMLVVGVGHRSLRKAGYYVWDRWVRNQVVIVAFQRPFASEDEQTKKRLTGAGIVRSRLITVGEGDDSWRAERLVIRRLFRPWQGPTVKIACHVRQNGSKPRRLAMTLSEENMPTTLEGADRVQVQLRVTRKGARV